LFGPIPVPADDPAPARKPRTALDAANPKLRDWRRDTADTPAVPTPKEAMR
jgi:hypothetical protein